MYQINATIEGIAPILFNRFTEENVIEVEEGRSVGRKTAEVKRKLARESKIYSNKDGLFCPAKNIKKAMTLACSIANLKYGRKGLGPILKAIMFIEPDEVPFNIKKPDYIDEQTGRIPPGARGARVTLYRPALKPGWKLSFIIHVFDDRVSLEQVKRSLEDAGIYQGLCDGRPEYGRFTISAFAKVEKQ